MLRKRVLRNILLGYHVSSRQDSLNILINLLIMKAIINYNSSNIVEWGEGRGEHTACGLGCRGWHIHWNL